MNSHRVYLGLGSNINPKVNLSSCCRYLQCSFKHIRFSQVYQSSSFGFTGPDFLNMVAEIYTGFNPYGLKKWLQQLENLYGRDRTKPKYSNRNLDIDLLLFDDLIIDNDLIQIPRREIVHRDYVLKPLAELAGDVMHPTRKKKLSTLWKALYEKTNAQLQTVTLV